MKLDKIIAESIHRFVLHESIQEGLNLMRKVCDKLNALANSVDGCNAIEKDGSYILLYRYFNFQVVEDTEYMLTFESIDEDGGKDKDSIYYSDWDENDEPYINGEELLKAAKEIENRMKKGIKYAQEHSQPIVPAKAQAKLDKLNASINNVIKDFGDNCIMMEEGDEVGYCAKNFRFEVQEDGSVKLLYDGDKGVEEVYCDYGTWFNNRLGVFEFNFEELNSAVRYYTSCLKRGIKFLNEYNPEWDDNEEAKAKFFNSNNDEEL